MRSRENIPTGSSSDNISAAERAAVEMGFAYFREKNAETLRQMLGHGKTRLFSSDAETPQTKRNAPPMQDQHISKKPKLG